MTIDDVALRVAEALGAAGVPFMLVGGDWEDVRAVMGVQGDKLALHRSWCERHGTWALLEEIRRTVPKV